jgi:hypothetical protein
MDESSSEMFLVCGGGGVSQSYIRGAGTKTYMSLLLAFITTICTIYHESCLPSHHLVCPTVREDILLNIKKILVVYCYY